MNRRERASRWFPLLLVLALLVRSTPAAAQTPPRTGAAVATSAPPAMPQRRLKWRYHRFSIPEYILTGLAAGAYLYLEFATKTPREPRWRGGFWVDDDVRDALVAESRTGRERAGVMSDFFTLAPQVLAVIDGSIVPVVTDHGNWDVAWQMTMINVEAIAITGLLSRFGHRVIARERPDVVPCLEDNGYHGLCFGGPNASFPSGHTSAAVEGAGLVCAHHLNLPLYGGASDVVVCGTMVAMSLTSGYLRIVSDRHYVSDIVVGAAIGAGAGFALPMLVNYREVEPSDPNAVSYRISPFVSEETLGLAMHGRF